MPANRLKLLVLGAIGVLAAIVAALGVVFVTMRQPAKPAGNVVTIEVSDRACTPGTVSVAAGTPDFRIKNTGNRAIEWEILDGVMVLAERENIAPGFSVELMPRLDPGTYQMTCGLLSNPHGTLTVVAADGSTTARPAAPRAVDLVAPTAAYRVYAIQSAEALNTAVAALAATVKANDLAGARAHAAEALAAVDHIAPVLPLFGPEAEANGPTDLATLDKRLAGSTSTDGLADSVEAAMKSAATLATAAHTTTAAPRDIIAGAAIVVTDLANRLGDSADTSARIAGVRKVVELFRPLALRADKTLSAKLDGDLFAVASALKQSPSGPPPQLADLAADLIDLQSALGLTTR
ncbi:MAG TPA: cupredoxin domain-containing protein [Devosiaceae bacterium]|nr:cupredoxin domain-containing protein [Devosiaceae bacterium]